MDPRTDKASSDAERRPRLARDDLFADLEEQVDYGSDTSMASPQRSPEPEARELRAPNPFPERGAAQGLTALRASSGLESGVITNALDEVQERQLEEGEVQRSQRPEARPLLSSHREYRFRARDPAEVVKEAMGQRSLRTWICGPAATAASELEARDALRARLLTPQETTPAEYGTRLADQARRASVPNMRTYPVVLLPGETAQEDDVLFRNWVERARQLPSLDALRASFSEVDVRLERRLLFEYAKVKTKRQAPSSSTRPPGPVPHAPPSYGSLHRGGSTAVTAPDQRLSSAADPVAPRPIVGKREATDYSVAGSRSALDLGDQKRPRRLGSLAGGVPQTPMSSQSGGTLATSPDTGYGPGVDDALEYVPHESGDSPARRATPAAPVPTQDEEPVRRHEMDRMTESLSDMRREVERHGRMLERAGADYDANVNEIRDLRERLDWYETPDSSSQRLQRLEQGLARLEGQLDLLLRLQQGAVAPPLRAPAPGAPPAPGPGTA